MKRRRCPATGRPPATTASILSDELGIGPVVTLTGLMERHAGEWQGLTRDEIEEDFPGYLDSGRRPPGWEPDEAVEARVLGAFDAIATQHPYGTVVAVAHAGVIFAAESALGGTWERLANLGGRWLEHTDAGWRIEEVGVPYRPREGRSKVTGTVRGTARAVRDMGALLRER